jgi:hypothetical protein
MARGGSKFRLGTHKCWISLDKPSLNKPSRFVVPSIRQTWQQEIPLAGKVIYKYIEKANCQIHYRSVPNVDSMLNSTYTFVGCILKDSPHSESVVGQISISLD